MEFNSGFKGLNIILVNVSFQWVKAICKESLQQFDLSVDDLWCCSCLFAPCTQAYIYTTIHVPAKYVWNFLGDRTNLHFPQIHRAATDSRPETFLSFTLHVSWKPFIKWSIVSCLAEKNRKTDIQDVSVANTKLTQATDISENLRYSSGYAQQPILSFCSNFPNGLRDPPFTLHS